MASSHSRIDKVYSWEILTNAIQFTPPSHISIANDDMRNTTADRLLNLISQLLDFS